MNGPPEQVPARVSARVRRRVEREYAGRARDEALYVLDAVDLGPWRIADSPAGRDRVHAAMLVLAAGDVRRLLAAAAEAETDWRDVLVAADLAGDDWARRVDELLGPDADPA